MCKCVNTNISNIPSVYCFSCKELLCVICDKDYFKCSSCSYFSCNKCTLKLFCNHNYCSIQCALDNNKNLCDKKCMFIRDIVSTDNTDYGLKNLLYYWINIELSTEYKNVKELIKEWLEDICDVIHKNDDKNNLSKIEQLQQLLFLL